MTVFVIIAFLVILGIVLYGEYQKDLDRKRQLVEEDKERERQRASYRAKQETEPPTPSPTARKFITRKVSAPPVERPLYAEDCLTSEQEKQAIHVTNKGVPNIEFKTWQNRLVPTVPEGIVNPHSRSLYKFGIFIFDVHGVYYHEQAAREATNLPGESAKLVREPNNPHDPNAIAIYDTNEVVPLGYVNKQNAKRLAPRLDAGEDFVAFFTAVGDKANEDFYSQVVVMNRKLAEEIL
ncbi:MAG: HIRAN domain-containing protein [Bifidobacteriaceae bacterium]|jgi:hypothetical protein|nr:HIRAN domain-containing protein [Bifidobacteriaceae bacterium]